MNKMSHIILLLKLFVVVEGFMDTELASSFFSVKHLKHNVVLTCGDKKTQVEIMKNLTKENDMVISVKLIKNLDIHGSIVFDYNKAGIVLDADCLGTEELLIRSRRYRVFDTKTFWLMLYNSNNYGHLFRYVNLNVDSDIKVAYPANDSEMSNKKYNIDDVYNQAYEKGGEFKSKKAGFYDYQYGYQVLEKENKYFVRRNLTGVKFMSAVVIPDPIEGSVDDYLRSNRDLQLNALNRFHARLMQYCRDYLNFSVEIKRVNSWGYLQPDGTIDGLSGQLWLHKVDFGSSPLFVKKERARVMSYGRKTWNLKGAFFLRNPKSRKSYQIFIKPLSLQVWIFIFISSILSVYSQRLGYLLDKQIDKMFFKNDNVDCTWSFSTICTFGAFCQQGIVSYPNSLSGRTAAFVTLLLGLLIYQFYSASLVSFLLNVPTTVIKTVQDILDNHFNIGCEDVLYVKDILKSATDNVTQEVYRRLLEMAAKNNQTGFMRPEEGLQLVKNGQYAFQAELVSGYPIIEKDFSESMICELKEIPMYRTRYMNANYQKWSPFKDMLDVCLQRLGENGAMARELTFWYPRKPKCIRSASTININTGLNDFYPALGVVVIGMVLSMNILLIEVIWHYVTKRKRLHVKNVVVFPYVN